MWKLLLIIFFPLNSLCQNTIGLPDVINYPKQAYVAGLQNWDIRQDINGIIYIANNEGLLSFDGKYWNIYSLPNKTIVRSVEIGADNKIYTGGQDELGYFSRGRNGRLQYTSLTNLIPPKDRSFGDVWDIASYNKSIFFRTPNKIFKFTNESITVFDAPSEWSYMSICRNHLYAHDYKNGLLLFENNIWSPLPIPNTLPVNDPVTGILPLQDNKTIITTLKNGLFVLNNNQYSPLSSADLANITKERIYAATALNEHWIALATSNGGVFITDSGGRMIQRFSKAEGLQNNNVLCVFLDKQGNLWLGLDNGIDFVAYNSAIKRIIPYSQDGSGYTAIIHNNNLYAGTSGGLFNVSLQTLKDLSFSKGVFSPVANADGQTWCLAEINNRLLLGHHEGAFVINQNAAQRLSSSAAGYWNFIPLSSVFPTKRIIAGNYKGLTFLNFENGSFSVAEEISGFTESSRFVAIDKYDNIWISHPYHGVFKATINNNGKYVTKLYTDKEGLPSALNNHTYKVRNEVVVTTEKGVYIYNTSTDKFEASAFYRKILGDQSLRYLKEDTDGNIWFIHEKNLGVVDMSGKEPSIVYLPELNNKLLSGFEFIYPVNRNNIFIGGEKGFFHINYEKYKNNIPQLQVHIRTVKIVNKKDSLLHGGYFDHPNETQIQAKNQVPDIYYKWGTIRFEYSSPHFGQQQNLEYSYRLKGFDNNWSEWGPKTDKEYTHLPSGNYTFEVKVRNNLGNESQVSGYSFRILPPWYQSILAYIVYFILLFICLYYIYKWQRRKFKAQQAKYEEEQRKIQYLHQLEMNKAENELIALRNEKLQGEIDFKNSELATSAMHLVQKGEILSRIRSELNQISKGLENEKATAEIKRLIKVLSEDEKMDSDWEHFARHFDKVHSDFVIGLKEKYPTITPNEIKLCAYLRMNLSTKEIAQLMNISVRGVEISRYRLRKKLGISSEINLFDYLISLTGKKKQD